MAAVRKCHVRHCITALSLGVAAIACSREMPVSDNVVERRAADMSGVSRMDTDSARARKAFERFLQLAVATNTLRIGRYDSVYTCPEDELYEDVRWVADSRVLDINVRGDTANVSAVLTTAAQQVQEDVGTDYVATVRIREDTGHWRMVRTGGAGWKVCGDSREGFGVWMIGRTIHWRPVGASRLTAHSVIDSIRRARGLPIMR